MDTVWSSRACFITFHLALLCVTSCKGSLRCECSTQECRDSGQSTCMAQSSCYTELYHNELTRGCDPSQLACENKKPAGLDLEWPSLYCCSERDLCNKYVVPKVDATTPGIHMEPPKVIESREEKEPVKDCPNAPAEEKTKEPGTKVINPIYIAVPVAGVCVLLALIIFAMYLLRRRTDYHHHENLYHYQPELAPSLVGHHPKQTVAPHHCQCICKKASTVPSSCSKGNRCTDSERSSSGSETKLFIQT